jgi:hypothetical protein
MAKCLLDPSQASALEHSGIVPNCRTHSHVSAHEAAELVEAGTHRYAGSCERRITGTPNYVWAVVDTYGLGSGWQMGNTHGSAARHFAGAKLHNATNARRGVHHFLRASVN